MSGKTLEERITILEDIEEIKKIKAKYCYYQDQKRSQEFMDLFTEDSELDYRPLLQEKMVGKAAFAPLFAKENMLKWERMACHHLANAAIT